MVCGVIVAKPRNCNNKNPIYQVRVFKRSGKDKKAGNTYKKFYRPDGKLYLTRKAAEQDGFDEETAEISYDFENDE